MLAELVDAVVSVDTYRDTHRVEIALATGTPIATCSISNDSTGYAELLAWIFDHAPGPRLVSIEGTRSYGVGLARAVATAGLTVLECEQPDRKTRRGKGKSDAINAHLACSAHFDSTPTGSPAPVPTVTRKHCGSCWVPARSPTPHPAPVRPRALDPTGPPRPHYPARS